MGVTSGVTTTRREFLRRADAATGLVAFGRLAGLPSLTDRVSLGTGDQSGIDHAIVVMMENRSFGRRQVARRYRRGRTARIRSAMTA